MKRRTNARALIVAAALAGCGGSAPPPPDGGQFDFAHVVDATVLPDLAIPLRDPTDHPPLVQIQFNQGRLLRHVHVVTVGWKGDPLLDERARFAGWMVDSTYWDPLKEYGLSRGDATAAYELDGPAPQTLDDAAVGPLLRSAIASGALPPAETDSLYILYLPEGTVSTMGTFGQGCIAYGGYHWTTSTGMGTPGLMAYAIIPDCVPGPSQFDSDTVVASHELAEAASDPDGAGWFAPWLPLSEIGDLCTPLDATITATFGASGDGGAADDGGAIGDGGTPDDGGVTTRDYLVSRLWSAKTAAQGTSDPCLPVPPSPYVWFGAAVDPDGATVQVGGSTDLPVQPFAYGPVGRISWHVIEGPALGLSIKPSSGSGMPGSTQIITISASDQAFSGPYPLQIQADLPTGASTVWNSLIQVQ
jgi:hypothetical protein